MRIAMVSFDTGEYCVRLAGGLARSGADVLLLLSRREAEPHYDKLDPLVNLVAFERPRYRHPRRQMLLLTRLLAYIRTFQPDVVHLQMGHLWFNLALPLLRGYPLVVTVHDVEVHPGDHASARSSQAVLDFGYHLADMRIVHAEAIRKRALERFDWNPDTVAVVPTVLRRDEGGTGEVPEVGNQILFFGRIWEYKGLEYLIKATPQITAAVPGAQVVIAGEGEDFVRYRAMMQNPDDFIVYNTYVSNEMRRDLFQQSSVVVLPYIEASQSGVVPLAYTARKPVVATTVGGLPEIVEDGKTGFLVPPRDADALAQAVIRLLQDADMRQQFGLAGERKMLTESSPDAVARKTIVVYQQAIERAQQRGAAHHMQAKQGAAESPHPQPMTQGDVQE